MALNDLKINIIANDKTKGALSSVQAGLSRLRSSLFSIQSALVTGIGAIAVKSLLDTGRQVEQLNLRFNFLFGNVKEGTKAFNNLVSYAAKVPFSLEEISAASGNLAVVSKDAEDLNDIMKVTGNVAAVTGLSFEITATQIQRSFAGGIAAADIFRERGVRALLGFEAGVVVTAEETKKRFFELFGPGGRFGKATEVLATTFTGTLSMLSDKLFKFRYDTNRAGVFDFVKNALVVINRALDENTTALAKFSQKVSEGLITFIKQGLLGAAALLDTLRPVFSIVGIGFAGLMDLVKSLPPGIREMGIIGFLMLGRTGKILIVGILGMLKYLGVNLDEITNKLFGANQEADKMGPAFQAVNEFLKKIDENILSSRKQLKEMLEKTKHIESEAKSISFSFKELAVVIKEMNDKSLKKLSDLTKEIARQYDIMVKNSSEAIAKAIVLGDDLGKSFKELLQNILVKILAVLIEIGIKIAINYALEKAGIVVVDQKTRAEAEHGNQVAKTNAQLQYQLGLQQQIAATKSAGGGGGGGGFGTVLQIASLFFAKGGAVSKGKPIVVGEQGPELFIPNTTGQISQSARGTSGGAVNVNFNINTVDARSFDDLLVRNRATITNIINQAVNEKGGTNLI